VIVFCCDHEVFASPGGLPLPLCGGEASLKSIKGMRMKPSLPRKVTNDIDQISASVWNQLIDCLAYGLDCPKGDNKTIVRQGDYLHVIRSASGVGSTAEDSGYYGPFAIVKKDDSTALMYGYNSSKERYFHNYVNIGLNAPLDVPEQEISISANAWIYLKITYNDGYTIEVKNGSDFPAQTNDSLYMQIAFVSVSDSKISEIIQYQYGSLSLVGRIL
jgi:hypothetical protein